MEENVEKLAGRIIAPELDAIIGKQFKVLDDGFIRVVDYMGGDGSIVQAARVSYGVGTKKVSEDKGLIRYLMRHWHTTPFEMCEIKLHVRVPMDCWRQWIRHRMASVNEYSTRYSEAIDACQQTMGEEWRLQSELNKQGSSGRITEYPKDGNWTSEITPGLYLSMREKQAQQLARDVYEERLKFGVAREQARKDLNLSTYTEAYWKIDLHNLLHFLRLRMDSHAQLEIRSYADVIGNEIVAKWVPMAWGAFKDYRMNVVMWSRLESEIMEAIHSSRSDKVTELAKSFGWLEANDKGVLKTNRERAEFEQKAEKLKLSLPWKE